MSGASVKWEKRTPQTARQQSLSGLCSCCLSRYFDEFSKSMTVPEHLFGHDGAFRLVQPLELRRLFDLIKFGVCREILIEDVKDGRLRDGG